jgi:hypothetical protein
MPLGRDGNWVAERKIDPGARAQYAAIREQHQQRRPEARPGPGRSYRSPYTLGTVQVEWSGVEKFADLQLQSSCGVQADCHNFNVSTMQAASVQPDVFLVTSDKGDKCKMIPTVKYHQPCTKIPWPSGSRASFKRRQPPPPDRALKLVDSILIR